jgi:hypothetical protein
VLFWHEKIVSVKTTIAFLALASFSLLIGCSRSDYTGAGESKGGDVSNSSAATPQDYGQKPPDQFDSASSGGSTTQASDPYSHNNGSAISQNINPAPFVGSSAGTLRGQNPQDATTNLATNRAVGEMEGATDQPPGAVAPGEMGPAPQPIGLSTQPFGGIGEGNAPGRNTQTKSGFQKQKPK